MNYRFIFIFVVFAVFFCGCSVKEERTYYENGNIKCIYKVKKGIKNGVSECYTESGKVKSIENFKNGKLDGESKLFNEKGDLELITNWKNGFLDGVTEQYYPNGNLFLRKYYNEGIQCCTVTDYHLNGSVAQKQILDNKGNVIYSMDFSDKGERMGGTVIPIITTSSDTISLSDNFLINVSFGYNLSGEVNINLEGLDSLGAPSINQTQKSIDQFNLELKFFDSGLHTFGLYIMHEPLKGDTLSADGTGKVFKVFVKAIPSS